MNWKILFLLPVFFVTAQTALADTYFAAQEAPDPERTLRQALEEEGHTRFLKLLEDAQLQDYLDKTGITLLVPDPEWFESLSDEEYGNLVSNREAVREALHAHTLDGLYSERDLTTDAKVKSLSGEAVAIEVDEEVGLVVNGLIVLRGDIVGQGFVLHVVDDFFVYIEESEPVDS